ncbi:hypothetical protein BaRGS_00003962 [Batillaria attramentaria]|uniref:Uncharacterized protein n=1 Tax=Batillaria attramentaria TaxID=370345 RepID=A0ABD0KJN8_9CAEN
MKGTRMRLKRRSRSSIEAGLQVLLTAGFKFRSDCTSTFSVTPEKGRRAWVSPLKTELVTPCKPPLVFPDQMVQSSARWLITCWKWNGAAAECSSYRFHSKGRRHSTDCHRNKRYQRQQALHTVVILFTTLPIGEEKARRVSGC